MISFRWYRSGALFGVRYTMEEGDEIPEHAHDESTLHNITVLHGIVELHELGDRTRLLSGVTHDFDGRQLHKIVCQSDQAVILNMFLHGIPQGYAELPESAQSGVV